MTTPWEATPRWIVTALVVMTIGCTTPPEGRVWLLTAGDATTQSAHTSVRLGQEQRPAWTLSPGTTHEVEVRVPRAATLRFGYGMSGQRLPIELEVTAITAAHLPGLVGDPAAHHLFRANLTPADGTHDTAWHDVEINLAALAGQHLRLRFGARAAEHGNGSLFIAHPELVAQRPARRPNIVVLAIDGLRADALSVGGHHRVTSPAIDAWTRTHGVLFTNSITTSPDPTSALVSLLSGLDALRHEVHDANHTTPKALPYLPQILHETGYRTAAIVADDASHDMRPGLARGFDRTRWVPHTDGPVSTLESQIQHALTWLDQLVGEPFFLLVKGQVATSPLRPSEPYFSTFHSGEVPSQTLRVEWPPPDQPGPTTPIDPPVLTSGNEVQRALTGADRPLVRTIYDSRIAAADEQVARLLAALKRLDVFDDTVIVLTGTHGVALGEEHIYPNAARPLAFGTDNMNPATLRVPLVISYPRVAPHARRVDSQVRSIDVAPTLVELAAAGASAGLDGQSLATILKGTDEPPRAAWSWSGAHRRTLALLPGSGAKFLLETTPWPERCSGESYRPPTGIEGTQPDAEVPPARLASLRRQALLHQQQHATGLLMRWRQGNGPHLTVQLSGDPRLPIQIARLGGACPMLRWRPTEQTLEISLAPGEETWLVWHAATRDKHTLGITADGGPTFHADLGSFPGLERGVVLRPSGTTWDRIPLRGITTEQDGVRVWWHATWDAG